MFSATFHCRSQTTVRSTDFRQQHPNLRPGSQTSPLSPSTCFTCGLKRTTTTASATTMPPLTLDTDQIILPTTLQIFAGSIAAATTNLLLLAIFSSSYDVLRMLCCRRYVTNLDSDGSKRDAESVQQEFGRQTLEAYRQQRASVSRRGCELNDGPRGAQFHWKRWAKLTTSTIHFVILQWVVLLSFELSSLWLITALGALQGRLKCEREYYRGRACLPAHFVAMGLDLAFVIALLCLIRGFRLHKTHQTHGGCGTKILMAVLRLPIAVLTWHEKNGRMGLSGKFRGVIIQAGFSGVVFAVCLVVL